jgi:MFS family permease
MQRPPVAELPPVPAAEQHEAQRMALRRLLSGAMLRSTVLSWSAFFLVMVSFYFVLSWTPKLLVAAGMSAEQGITGGVLLNLGGIVGGSLFAYLTSRLPLRPVAIGCMLLSAGLIGLFGAAATKLTPALLLAPAIGAVIFSSMIGLYAIAPRIYPAAVRSTGMGWAIGMGRTGAIVSPTVAGVLLDLGWKPGGLYYLFALPLLAGALAVRALRDV